MRCVERAAYERPQREDWEAAGRVSSIQLVSYPELPADSRLSPLSPLHQLLGGRAGGTAGVGLQGQGWRWSSTLELLAIMYGE